MNDRRTIAEALEEIGLLLELKGENPFKTRAYNNAARILKGMTDDLDTLVERGELSRIKGIGNALAEKIAILATTGELPHLEQLRAEVPPGLLEWLKIPGLGPRKARAIHGALEISTLGELEYACRENRLRGLEGFGPASQKKILEGIQHVRKHAGRFLHPVVVSESSRLLDVVRGVDGVLRAAVCGSVRRRNETSKDIDIVVSARDAERVMDAFTSDDGVRQVTGRGPTKCSVLLQAGPAADLRVVDDAAYPFAELYFTGSKAHNIAVRGRAQRMGLKLNEYALIRENDGDAVVCRDEAEIYRALQLDPIPPELREDLGEIDAAASGTLPDLVTREDLVGVLHCHSSWSDGIASISEMADASRARGLAYLGLCDHSRSAAYAGGLDVERVRRQHEEIDLLNASSSDGFRILKGIEVDILADGSLDFPDEVLESFDVVVASVHSRFQLSERDQTDRILRALDNPFVDILGHPTGRLLLSRDPYPLDLHRVIRTAAERGVAIEVNAHPQRLDLDWQGLRYGLARGLLTSINPDAHSTEGLDVLDYGVGIARKGWCTAEDVLDAWPLERLTRHLRERREATGAKGGPA